MRDFSNQTGEHTTHARDRIIEGVGTIRTVSEPGAAIRVEEIHLTPEMREKLVVSRRVAAYLRLRSMRIRRHERRMRQLRIIERCVWLVMLVCFIAVLWTTRE